MEKYGLGIAGLVIGAIIAYFLVPAKVVEKLVTVERVGDKTLDAVKSKGFIQCGVSQGVPGFSNPDTSGNWSGIDVDVCRAVAAAVYGDASKVKYSPLTAKERFTALQSGEIDILSRNTTWTLVRDTALGLNFAGVNYYDGQGFMVRKSLGVKSALELAGAAVCTNLGTTTELNVADYFRANEMKYKLVAFEKADEVVAAYDAGRCDVYTTDRSALAAQRTKLKNPDEHMVLPEIISKEPLGPVVRHGDDRWLDIVKWSLYAMLESEEMGITSANVDSMKSSTKNPGIMRLLGVEGDLGKNLGLGKSWAYDIIKQVGNYGESYDRNVGPDTPVKLARGVNALWNQGGLMYPMPAR
jgi:general L-amino acid transport system substrate-binding protein